MSLLSIIGLGIASAQGQTASLWPHAYGVIPSFCIESAPTGVPVVSTSVDRALDGEAPNAGVFADPAGVRTALPAPLRFAELKDSPECRQILASLGVSNLETGAPVASDLPIFSSSAPRPYCDVAVTPGPCQLGPDVGFVPASNNETGIGDLDGILRAVRTTGRLPDALGGQFGILVSRDRPGIYASRTSPNSLYVCFRQPSESDRPSFFSQVFGGRRGSRDCGQWVGLYRTDLNAPNVPSAVAQNFVHYPEVAGLSPALLHPIQQELDRYALRLTTLGIDLNDPAAEIFREWRSRLDPGGEAASQAGPILESLVHLLKDKEIEMLWDRDVDFRADAATWWSARRMLLKMSCTADLSQAIAGREGYVREQYRAQSCRRQVAQRAYGRIQDAYLRRQNISLSNPGLLQMLQIGSRVERLTLEVLQVRSWAEAIRNPELGDFSAFSRRFREYYPRSLFLQGLGGLLHMLELLAVESRSGQMASGLGPVPQRPQDQEAIRNAWTEGTHAATAFWEFAQHGAFSSERRSDVLVPFASVWARVVFLLELPDSYLSIGGTGMRERTDLAALTSWGEWIATGTLIPGSEQRLTDRIALLLNAAEQRNPRALNALLRSGLALRPNPGVGIVLRQRAERFRNVEPTAVVSPRVRSAVRLLMARWASDRCVEGGDCRAK